MHEDEGYRCLPLAQITVDEICRRLDVVPLLRVYGGVFVGPLEDEVFAEET